VRYIDSTDVKRTECMQGWQQQVAALLELKLTESLYNIMLTRICKEFAHQSYFIDCWFSVNL